MKIYWPLMHNHSFLQTDTIFYQFSNPDNNLYCICAKYISIGPVLNILFLQECHDPLKHPVLLIPPFRHLSSSCMSSQGYQVSTIVQVKSHRFRIIQVVNECAIIKQIRSVTWFSTQVVGRIYYGYISHDNWQEMTYILLPHIYWNQLHYSSLTYINTKIRNRRNSWWITSLLTIKIITIYYQDLIIQEILYILITLHGQISCFNHLYAN